MKKKFLHVAKLNRELNNKSKNLKALLSLSNFPPCAQYELERFVVLINIFPHAQLEQNFIGPMGRIRMQFVSWSAQLKNFLLRKKLKKSKIAKQLRFLMT
jgi:hypothetical protein